MSDPTTSGGPGEPQWEPGADRRPTTAEAAVPWLIGIVLLLSGIVIVLLVALITIDAPMTAEQASPSPSGRVARGILEASPAPATASPRAETTAEAEATPAATATPAPTPAPTPAATPTAVTTSLDLLFLGREAATAPLILIRNDFAVSETPTAVVGSGTAADLSAYDWAPDGSHGAVLVNGRAVLVQPDGATSALGDGIATFTFGPDAATLYAARVVSDGSTDTASVVAITAADGTERQLASFSYPTPTFGFTSDVEAAQFLDEGGPIRLRWLNDGRLVFLAFGGPSYAIGPADGATSEAAGSLVLSTADGERRIELMANTAGTTLQLIERGVDEARATTTVAGLVSHVRWSAAGDLVAFTLGTPGGVRQDLHLWDLTDGVAPRPLTTTGAAFGPEWLGAPESWTLEP
jgi:hypothetical protein